MKFNTILNMLKRTVFFLLVIVNVFYTYAFPTAEYNLNGKKVIIELLPEGRFSSIKPIQLSFSDKTPIYYIVTSSKKYDHYHYNGVASLDGKVIIQPKYKYINYQNGCFIVTNFADKMGVVDSHGKVIIEPLYEQLYFNRFKDSKFVYFKTEKGGKVGIITAEFDGNKYTKVKEILKPNKYASAVYSGKGFTIGTATSGGFKGRLDLNGKLIIESDKYTDIQPYIDGRYVVRIGNRSGVCDNDGQQLFFTDFNEMKLFKDEDGTYFYGGYIGNAKGKCDYDGNWIVRPTPSKFNVRKQNNGYIYNEVYDERGNVGIADTLGNIIIPVQYDSFHIYKGFIYGHRDGCLSLFSLDGKSILPISKKYNFIVPTLSKDGKIKEIRIFKNEYQGLCDSIGKEIVAPNRWHYVSSREEGFEVRENGLCGIIDKEGKIIVPCAYDYISTLGKDNLYCVKHNALSGIVDSKGFEIVPPLYTSANIYQVFDKDCPFDRYIKVKNGDYEGIYSIDGNVIFPVSTYTSVSISHISTDNISEIGIVASDQDRKCYFDFNGNLLRDLGQEKLRQDYMDNGSDHFANRRWNEAFKAYEKADKIHSDYYSSFNMGVSKYNAGKYSDAIKYLNIALNRNPGPQQREKIISILENAVEINEEMAARRKEAILSIFTFGLNIASEIINMNNVQKQRRIDLNNYGSQNASLSSGCDNDNNSNEFKDSSKKQSACGFCGGKGSTVEYTANYGIKKDFYCDECGKTVTNGHYHRTCTHCGGKGVR